MNDFELRFSSSKSFETIDAHNTEDKYCWYDLTLIMVLLDDKLKLDVVAIKAQYEILRSNLGRIRELFKKQNYLTTKMKLDEIGNERARLMFPGKIIP